MTKQFTDKLQEYLFELKYGTNFSGTVNMRPINEAHQQILKEIEACLPEKKDTDADWDEYYREQGYNQALEDTRQALGISPGGQDE